MENCLAMANNLRLFGNLASALNPNNLASLMEAATAAAAAAQRARTKFAAKNSADFVPVNNVQTMETWVLIPPELSLVLSTNPDENLNEKTNNNNNNNNNNSAAPARVWTRVALAGGRRLSPFQGTVRLGVMPSDPPCPEDDIRSSYGCYDEITQVHQRKVRHCNWVRFLRHVPVLTPEVNIVCSKVKGEPIYEVVRPIPAYTELVVFYLPGHPDEEFYLPAVRSLRSSLFRRTMGLILEDSPLDLSLALLSPKNNFETSAACPVLRHTSSTDLTGRQSVSSESVTSSAGELDLDAPVVMVTGHGLSPHLHRHHPSPHHHHHHHHHPAVSNNHHRPSRQRPLLPCQVCGKAFDRPSLLNRHMRTHTGEKPHVCEVCGKGFSTSSSLNTHRRIHSGEKPHECPVCGKRFTASSNLYYHRMTHIKEKPHKCALCSKSFPTPGDLKSHMYVHSGSWPFKCHVCNRGFSKHTNLKNHLFLHTGDKPHACELCNKRFALACNLRAHMKTHEGEPQEECLRCGKHFLLVNNTSSSSTATEDRYCPECCGSSPGADPDESKEDIDVVEDSISDPEPDPEIDIDIDEK